MMRARWAMAITTTLAVGARLLEPQQPTPSRTDAPSLSASHGNQDGAPTQDPLARRISLLLVNATIPDALTTIGAQAGVRLTYSSDDIPSTKHVSFAEHNVTVGAALDAVLAHTKLHAVAMPDGAIVLATGGAQATAPARSASLADRTPLLTGRVLRPDGQPVQGATVGLVGWGDTLATSDSGRFAFPDVAPGTYILWARQVGFRLVGMPVTIAEQLPTVVTVTLMPFITSLAAVTTTSMHTGYQRVGFDERMRSGVGQFMTYEEIVAVNAEALSELLRRFRGISVGGKQPGLTSGDDGPMPSLNPSGGMWLEGNCTAIAIDGIAQGVLDSHDLDDVIKPVEIGAIEAYPASEMPGAVGPMHGGARLPVMIVGDRDLTPPQCALVVIWTRQHLGIRSP